MSVYLHVLVVVPHSVPPVPLPCGMLPVSQDLLQAASRDDCSGRDFSTAVFYSVWLRERGQYFVWGQQRVWGVAGWLELCP